MRSKLVLLILLLVASFSFAITINTCSNISNSGDYTLINAVSGANQSAPAIGGNACIGIYASNLNFSCLGLSITDGGAAGVTAGIFVNTSSTNVTIKDCNVTGFFYGAFIEGSTYVNITNSTLFHAAGGGLYVNKSSDNYLANITSRNSSTGVRIISSNLTQLINNTLIFSSAGVYFQDALNAQITSNLVYNHSGLGYRFLALNHSSITSNTGNNSFSAFQFDTGSTNNTVVSNTANNNTQYGFNLQSVSNTTFSGANLAYSNLIDGVLVQASTNITITGLSAYLNTQNGMDLYLGSNSSNFSYNQVYNNSQSGILVLTGSSYNVLLGNNVTNNSLYGIDIDNGNNNNLTSNRVRLNTLAGFRINKSNSTTLQTNLAESNVQYGFYLNYSNFTLFDQNTVNLNPAQVHIQQTFLSNFTSNTIQNTSLAGFNISQSGSNNYLYNVVSNAASVGMGGVGISVSYDNISYNNLTNVTTGIMILANNSNVSNNRVGGTTSGINMSGNSNTFSYNYLFNNSNYGASMPSGSNLNASNNQFVNNTIGLQIYGMSGTSAIRYNTADLGTTGYQMGTSGSGVTFAQMSFNNATSNQVGYNLTNITDSNISNNIALNDSAYGFYLQQSNRSNFLYNTANTTVIALGIFNSTNISISNDHYFNTSTAGLRFNSSSINGSTLNVSGVSFDNPSGNYSSYQNLSFYDTAANSTSYDLLWTPRPGPLPSGATSFESKYVNITSYSSASLESLQMLWTSAEVAGYDESSFRLYRYTLGSWVPVDGSTLSISTHRLAASTVFQFGTFAIFAVPGTSESSPSSTLPLLSGLVIEFSPSCSVNKVGATYNDAAASGSVEVYHAAGGGIGEPIASGSLDSSGIFLFEGCGSSVIIRVITSTGTKTLTGSLVSCNSCNVPMCTTDLECANSETCVLGTCTSLACIPPAVPRNHACFTPPPISCLRNSDCGATQTCNNGMCVAISCPTGRIIDRICITTIANETSPLRSECVSDSDCASNTACNLESGGARVCEPVSRTSVCGEVRNHQFISFQCGTEPGCNSCGTGFICQDHRCVSPNLLAPNRTTIGSDEQLRTILGNAPLPNVVIRVTDPSGQITTIRTDAAGLAKFKFARSGTYKFELLENGKIIKTINVTALSRRGSGTIEDALAAVGDVLVNYWWLVSLVVIGGAYLLYRRYVGNQEGKSRTHKERE